MEETDRLYDENGSENWRMRIGGWEGAEWRLGDDGPFVRREQSGLWVMTEHRMGGKGADVWCGPRKVYRLSENTL